MPEELYKLPSETTPEHGFWVSCYNVGCTQTLLNDLDLAYDWFSVCMWEHYQVMLNPADFREVKLVIVPTQFKCYHNEHSFCGGYWVGDPPMIILAYKTPTGILDYYEHELRDWCVRILHQCPESIKEDVGNRCTKYKHIGGN